MKNDVREELADLNFGGWPQTDVSTPWRIVSWRILIWRFAIDPPKRQIKVPAKFTGYMVCTMYHVHVPA